MDKKLYSLISDLQNTKDFSNPKLKSYYLTSLKNFQHERLIHLIVTMFIAFFFLLFFIFTACAFLIIQTSSVWGNIFIYSSAFITTILLITTLFYLRHYYRLENGVQKLEDLIKNFFINQK